MCNLNKQLLYTCLYVFRSVHTCLSKWDYAEAQRNALTTLSWRLQCRRPMSLCSCQILAMETVSKVGKRSLCQAVLQEPGQRCQGREAAWTVGCFRRVPKLAHAGRSRGRSPGRSPGRGRSQGAREGARGPLPVASIFAWF